MHDGATEECVLACTRLANRIVEGQVVAVDTSDLILFEYIAALRSATDSGVAKKLAATLWRRRHDTRVCARFPITPIDDPPGAFGEVPEAVRDFDTDDQKFLAVAAAVGSTPPIFQALDTEWWTRRADLTAAGFDIQFLCVADMLAA